MGNLESGAEEALAVERPECGHIGFAQPLCLFQDRVEHRRQIAGRGIDDLQYLGQRRFPRQRQVAFLPKLCVSALKPDDHLVLSRGHASPPAGQRQLRIGASHFAG